MKKLIPIALFTLLLISTALAAAPTLTNTYTLNTTTGIRALLTEIDDTHVLIGDIAGSNARLRIVNTVTGQVTDTYTSPAVYLHDIDYEGGTIIACQTNFIGGTGYFQTLRVLKWPKEGYLQYKGGFTSSCSGDCSAFFGGCRLDKSSSSSADIFVQNFDWPGTSGTNRDGVAKVWFNGSFSFTDYPIIVPLRAEFLYDMNAEVIGTGNDFYDFSDEYNNSGRILDTLTYGTNLVAWNHDSNNPEWVTDDGYIALTDDYQDVIQASGSVTMDDIYAMSGIDNIMGVIDGWWYTADFSENPGDPSLTNTTQRLTNYDPSPSYFPYLTTDTNFYYFNETNNILTVWEYQTAPSCQASQGCYIDDSFSYSDSIYNHGWSGEYSAKTPEDGGLRCLLQPQYYVYDYTPLVNSEAPFTLDFDLDMCGDSSANMVLQIGSNGVPGFQLRFQADTLGGRILDENYNQLVNTVGDNISDPGNLTCSGLPLFSNHYTIVGNQNSNPKTYDLYINGALASAANLWNDNGQAMSSTNYLYLSASVAPNYCWWTIDNIELYTEVAPSANASKSQSTIYGIDFSIGATNPFDEDKLCAPTENRGLCFLRVIFKGLLGSLWRAIINNPLESLALILVIAVIIATSVSGRRR